MLTRAAPDRFGEEEEGKRKGDGVALRLSSRREFAPMNRESRALSPEPTYGPIALTLSKSAEASFVMSP